MGGGANLDKYPSEKDDYKSHLDQLFDLAMKFDVVLDTPSPSAAIIGQEGKLCRTINGG
jgi:hypothetical protein